MTVDYESRYKETRKAYRQSEAGKLARQKYSQSDKGKASKKKYAHSEKGRQNERNKEHRRRSILDKLESFTLEEWNTLLEKYNHICLSCRRIGMKLTADHVIPISKGGTNTIDNIQPLCRSCNSKKKDKHIDYREKNT